MPSAIATSPAEELWRHPDPHATPMWAFLQQVNKRHSLDIREYAGLYEWSIQNVELFWGEVWDFVGIKASKPYDQVSQ